MGENKSNTFLKWIDNTWYHYKPHIIIGLFAIILVCVGLFQSMNKYEPDVFIYYVGEGEVTVKRIEQFRSDMENLILKEDYNGDGKKFVDYKEDIFVMYSVEGETENNSYVYNSTEQMNIVKRFNMELAMGECIVYIMDPNLYKANKDYILSLEEALGYVPDFAYDNKGIELSDLVAYRLTGLSAFPENYVICIRAKRASDDEKNYKGNLEFFKSLTEYK